MSKVITVATPGPTTVGVTVSITNTVAGRVGTIAYASAVGTQDQTTYTEAELAAAPLAVRNAIDTLFNAVMAANVAPARMGF